MAAISCIAPHVSREFATKVVDKLDSTQLEKYGITNAEYREDAIRTLADIISRHVGQETDFSKREQMLQDVDGFIHDLENFFGIVRVSEDEFENTQNLYEQFQEKVLKPYGLSRMANFDVSNNPQEQEYAKDLLAILESYNDVVSFNVSYHDEAKTKIKTISFILMEPYKQEGLTAQGKAVETIKKIADIEVSQYPVDIEITDGDNIRYVKKNKDIPTGWQKTGKYHYRYNGKVILTNSVRNDANGYNPDGDFPVLAAPIGTYVDTVGRLFFDKESDLYDADGNLKNDEELEELISMELGGIFTIQGLKNLIKDYKQLETQIEKKWGIEHCGKPVQVFSGDVDLFGKQPNSDLWIHGKPDLLVIDGNGVVHVIDFKTSKMFDIKGYQNVLHDEYTKERAEEYGKQVSRYIRILESYGLNVDNEPYVVLIDTWYDSSDHGAKNYNGKGDLIKGRKDVYEITESGSIIVKEQEKTLGEYAEANPATVEEVVTGEKDVLYMEPRLHVGYEEGIGFSEELAALRGKEDIPFDSEVSYEQQWETLTLNEKNGMKWLGAIPVQVKTAQGVVTLSSNDIESNPELIGSQEISDVAGLIMYQVNRTITSLQRGQTYEEFPLSQPVGQTGNSAVKGKSREDIIRQIGIDNLIDYAFKNIEGRYHEDFPTEEEYKEGNYDDLDYDFEDESDYQQQKLMNDKAKWLIDHKEQLIMAGSAKLMALENSIIPIKNKSQQSKEFNESAPDTRMQPEDLEAIVDTGDNESNESFADLYLEGITDIEAWMLGQRQYSPKASLAQEIKRMFEDIDMVDENGKVVKDPYGWNFSMNVDATKAIQTVLDACKYCETIEEQIEALKELARNPQNLWVNQILDKINQDKNLKKKFFRHFRKDNLLYSICQVKFDKKTGQRTIETHIINMKSAYDTISQSLGASFTNGMVGSYSVNGVTLPLVSKDASGNNILTKIGNNTVARYIKRDISKWENYLKSLYQSYSPLRDGGTVTEYVAKQIEEKKFEGKTIIKAITEILHGVGVMVPQDVVLNACLSKIGKGPKTSNAGNLLNNAKRVLNHLSTMDKGKGIPASLKGNSAFRSYKPMLIMLADSVQEFVEASVYQDGKTYFSYTNPSKIGHIVRNLKDALGNEEKFEKYLKDNFGRYTGWFRDVKDEEWLCDWVRQFATDSSARTALQHKVELSYIGNQYRNLGALGFQLSILHNYFGSKDDQASNKNYRYFALPTMSNKPTNEFLRMLKYKDTDEIIDKVLMKTFQQEMNRMADVLYHYIHHSIGTDQIDLTDKKLEKAGWSEEEIQTLKDRIDSKSVQPEDIIRLSSITSGAKFHFLWYLNDAMKQSEDLAFRITNRLNTLLTSDQDEKDSMVNPSYEANTDKIVRATIASSMERIVESELEEMRKIGLFEKEKKKINGKEVEILKYQEEFGDMLGDSMSPTAEEEMENALRDFIWQDIAANINIIQITGGDLAYYGNAVNYQKRIAQIHSPGLHLMHDDDYDDGYLRSVHISDEAVRDEIKANTEVALEGYMEKMVPVDQRDGYKKMISIIISGLTEALVTDGQSFSSPTSIRKKLALQGEWDDNKEKAYKAISKGDFNINHLGVMLQPTKPFVPSDMAKYSGSPTMELRKTPLQDKNSEYLIILAEALAKGSGKRSKLVAICNFMEATAKFGNGKQGIDTTHFASVNKVGKSGVIDISAFDKEFNEVLKKQEEGKLYSSQTIFGEILDNYRRKNSVEKISEDDYNELLKEYLLSHVRTKGHTSLSVQDQDDFDANERLVQEGKLKREETLYNSQYVDTIPVEDYIIQQEVPAHLLQAQGQLYGSQIRILGISDITPGTQFQVNGMTISDEQLVNEYKELHAQNITESFEDLMEELGLDKLKKFIDNWKDTNPDGEAIVQTIADLPIGNPIRDEIYKNLASLLQKELSKDAKYGLDMYRACTLQYDTTTGNVIDFAVPLMDPIQSKRIQMLINSIIKKSINKQRITGGPVVQTTAYDSNLHIRFKHKNGGLLLTREEYEGWEPATHQTYEEYVKENQAGIAYFECYMPIPNAALERLMLKPDGSMMSFEELQEKLPKDVFDSMMQVIGYRIPTEDKYSMVPLKIMGFVPKAAGQVIMMPQEITYLTGSDFDIDKMYIMMKAFRINKDVSKRDKQGRDDVNALLNSYIAKKGPTASFPGIQKVIQQTIDNFNRIIDGDERISWETGIPKDINWEKEKDFIEWYRDNLLKTVLSEYIHYTQEELDDLKKKGIEISRKELREGRNNRLLDLQWAVLTNEDTASKMLNPGNFNDQKKVGRIIHILRNKTINPETEGTWTWQELSDMDIDKLDSLLEDADPHNTTLPSSKIYFQRQNMQGSQMVGIFANHNVSHAFLTFQKIGIDLYKGQYDNTFMFDGVEIGNHDDPTILDPQVGFNGQLISKTIASFLAASVDTAKDPTLSDMNINTFTGGVAMALARMGFDTAAIGLFLSQPIIFQLSDLFFKNRTDGYYDGETAIQALATQLGMSNKELLDTDGIKDGTLSKENFIMHLNDTDYEDGDTYQKRILIAFNSLYRIAKDLGELTFCTKFNSVSNAVGPTIADTMSDLDKVESFIARRESSVFYIPRSDAEDFTDVAEVIINDPILKAFYESTVDSEGASERIFKNFFPHYYEGFKNVKDYFQSNFMGDKKMSSKLYNQLLDEYLYYMLTYNGIERDNYMPTIPYSTEQKNRLVNGLVGDFQAVLKIKGRKPNMLLDQNLGANCIRVRERDEFIGTNILVFNGSQMNSDTQQQVRNAWSDLITMNDSNLSKEDNDRIIRFGVDLFFYTLMRNGFGFSPKTLMHLASVVVRYNAKYASGFNNYIVGLRNLKALDNYLMGDSVDGLPQIKNFCSQFIRNHANNGQLIPKVDFENEIVLGGNDTEVEIGVPVGEEHKLYRVMSGKDNPYGFITVITKDRATKKLTSQLYELEEIGGDRTFIEGGMTKIRYKKANRLGLTNNFIEYDANSPLTDSYFESIRNDSEDDLDEENTQQEYGRDEQEERGGFSVDPNKKAAWSVIMNEIVVLEGPQKELEYRKKLRAAYQKEDKGSPLVTAFENLLAAGSSEDKQKTMDDINKEFKKQNKC